MERHWTTLSTEIAYRLLWDAEVKMKIRKNCTYVKHGCEREVLLNGPTSGNRPQDLNPLSRHLQDLEKRIPPYFQHPLAVDSQTATKLPMKYGDYRRKLVHGLNRQLKTVNTKSIIRTTHSSIFYAGLHCSWSSQSMKLIKFSSSRVDKENISSWYQKLGIHEHYVFCFETVFICHNRVTSEREWKCANFEAWRAYMYRCTFPRCILFYVISFKLPMRLVK